MPLGRKKITININFDRAGHSVTFWDVVFAPGFIELRKHFKTNSQTARTKTRLVRRRYPHRLDTKDTLLIQDVERLCSEAGDKYTIKAVS